MIFRKKITPRRLKRNGWQYMEICPFTNKPKWWKGTHKLPHIDLYTETFTYDSEDSTVTYNGGEFSKVKKTVTNMKELKLFYYTLNFV